MSAPLDPRFWGPEPTRLTVLRSYVVGWLWGIKHWINGIDNLRIDGIVNHMTPAGRPEIGQPINIRLGGELLTRVDDYAARQSISRAQALRALVKAALAELDDDTIAGY